MNIEKIIKSNEMEVAATAFKDSVVAAAKELAKALMAIIRDYLKGLVVEEEV